MDFVTQRCEQIKTLENGRFAPAAQAGSGNQVYVVIADNGC